MLATGNPAISSEAKLASLGASLEEARTSDFFQWFHLAEVREGAAIDHGAQQIAGETWHRFRPSGASFHEVVELAVGVDGDERICTACLGIDRAFISDARIRPFARDIAKSFLSWILPADANNALAAEIDAISQFCDGESVVIARAAAVPAPGQPRMSRLAGGMADVFIGNAAHAEQTIGPIRISFENRIEPLPRGVLPSPKATLRAVPGKGQQAWLRLAVLTLGVG
jgi:hypothetical protein